MKKRFFTYIFFVLTIFFTKNLNAQEPADALRYSWYISSGTARQQSIGGAMGSLGGEISATFVNPAGIGFYKTGDFVLTPGLNSLKNKSKYFGRTENDSKSYFSFGTSGFVGSTGSHKRNGQTRSGAISIAINRTANFGSNILYRGQNTQSSYSQKFLEEIRNDNVKDANVVAQGYPYGTSLAFNTYWIDTIAGGSSGNYQFQSRAVPLLNTGLLQENNITQKGGITELAIAGAMNYNDKFYWGATIAVPLLHYERNTTFTEADATNNTNNNFDFASITENLKTDGVGVNVKAGIIYEPVQRVRLGFAFHSPTYFSLEDKYNSSVTTNTENYQGEQTQTSQFLTGADNGDFKYALLTPYRLMISGTYILNEVEDVKKQKGFLTADIEFINYKSSSFHTESGSDADQATKDYLKQLNSAIKNAYKGALNFRVGGELKFTTIMARLGAAYYGNPYQDLNGENGNHFSLSGGLGYRDKGIFVDLAYVYTMGKDVHFPYRLQYSPFTGAAIKNTGGNIVLTIGFKIS